MLLICSRTNEQYQYRVHLDTRYVVEAKSSLHCGQLSGFNNRSWMKSLATTTACVDSSEPRIACIAALLGRWRD